MSAQPQLMVLFSLAENPRGQLVDWYEEVQTQARSLCAPYDPAGALSLVAIPSVWEDFPGKINNRAEVAAGTHPPDYRASPTYARPADFANNAAAAVCCHCGEQAGPGQALCLHYCY